MRGITPLFEQLASDRPESSDLVRVVPAARCVRLALSLAFASDGPCNFIPGLGWSGTGHRSYYRASGRHGNPIPLEEEEEGKGVKVMVGLRLRVRPKAKAKAKVKAKG